MDLWEFPHRSCAFLLRSSQFGEANYSFDKLNVYLPRRKKNLILPDLTSRNLGFNSRDEKDNFLGNVPEGRNFIS